MSQWGPTEGRTWRLCLVRMCSFFRWRRLVSRCAFTLLLALPVAARAASFCLDTAGRPPPARALAMAAAAQREHRAFGGQAMDAEGRLTESGLSEAEDGRRGRAFKTCHWRLIFCMVEAVAELG